MSDDILLVDFKPRTKLVTRQTTLTQPRFPVIDAHLHLAPPYGKDWLGKPVSELLGAMDADP